MNAIQDKAKYIAICEYFSDFGDDAVKCFDDLMDNPEQACHDYQLCYPHEYNIPSNVSVCVKDLYDLIVSEFIS